METKTGKELYEKVEALSTGIPKLDFATGIGGFPKGRLTEVYGEKSTGKTALALSLVSEAQKKNRNCVWVDAECAFHFDYAKSLGVDTDSLTFVRSEFGYGEEYMEMVGKLIPTSDVIVVDSLDAITPRAKIEAELGAGMQMGMKARLLGDFFRKYIHALRDSHCVLVFINQMRLIDLVHGIYGTSGGKAQEFYTSLRIKSRKVMGGDLKQGDEIVGSKFMYFVEKNKVAAPYRSCVISYLYNTGFSKEADLFEEAVEKGVIVKRGNTFYFGEKKLGTKSVVREALKDDKLRGAIEVSAGK